MATTSHDTELTEQKPYASNERPKSEFDPCNNAKITPPFYLYKHDSPRPSFDVSKSQNPVKVTVNDLEAGSNLSPSITQEKRDAQNAAASNRFMFWKRQKQRCLTKPKERGCAWLSRLPPRQRIVVKIMIGLLVLGAAVAIAVSVSIKVGGGVYKNGNTSTEIG